jgi:hypothetical protein
MALQRYVSLRAIGGVGRDSAAGHEASDLALWIGWRAEAHDWHAHLFHAAIARECMYPPTHRSQSQAGCHVDGVSPDRHMIV